MKQRMMTGAGAAAMLLAMAWVGTPAHADSAGTEGAAPAGAWVAYTSDPSLQAMYGPVSAASEADQSDVAARSGGCVSGTTNYPSQPQFNCLSVTLDGSGEKVVLRQGTTGSFGYLHALNTHNVEQQTMENTVSINTGGYLQPNGRYLYGAYYQDPNGDVVIAFELIQERNPGAGSPDPYELGIVTAYCRDSASAPTRSCPQWVNDSL